MTAQTMPRHIDGRRARAYHRVVFVLLTAAKIAGAVVASTKTRTRPVARHLSDHVYTIIGFSFFDGAMFYHSVFTGLLVTGISWLAFEWKVSE